MTAASDFPGIAGAIEESTAGTGRLVVVVGPSGSGKDSLLKYVRERSAPAQRLVFPRRYITRAGEAGGEDHIAISEAEFDAKLAAGAFALHWAAHGHRYGIGAVVRELVEQGWTAVVSGSREHLGRTQLEFPDLAVVWVTAKPEVLRRRLHRRGREDPAAIATRLDRAHRFTLPDRLPCTVIDNDGSLEHAGGLLLDALLALRRCSAPDTR